MDKKYNGFNNGRDKSDGVGGREVNHGTQETMTKEQILEILNNVYRNHMTPGIATGIIHKQLSAERERAGKLVELLKEIDKSLYIGNDLNDIDILHWYINVITVIKDEIKQTLNDYDTATKESR